MKRHSISKRSSKRLFKNTALRHRPINDVKAVPLRGGIRL